MGRGTTPLDLGIASEEGNAEPKAHQRLRKANAGNAAFGKVYEMGPVRDSGPQSVQAPKDRQIDMGYDPAFTRAAGRNFPEANAQSTRSSKKQRQPLIDVSSRSSSKVAG